MRQDQIFMILEQTNRRHFSFRSAVFHFILSFWSINQSIHDSITDRQEKISNPILIIDSMQHTFAYLSGRHSTSWEL